MASTSPINVQLTLYTDHDLKTDTDQCDFASRIVLKELAIHYKEVLIDLRAPRPDWYLKINPAGRVPTLHIETPNSPPSPGTFLTESGLIVDFLIEGFPSSPFPNTLTPHLHTPLETALQRWRQRHFIDTFSSKLASPLFKLEKTRDPVEQQIIIDGAMAQITKEIELRLSDADPFFGGSEGFTVVEAMTMPFLLLFEDYVAAGVWPEAVLDGFNSFPNFSRWMKAGLSRKSVQLDQDVREARGKMG